MIFIYVSFDMWVRSNNYPPSTAPVRAPVLKESYFPAIEFLLLHASH